MSFERGFENLVPDNPVELAQPYAQELCFRDDFIDLSRSKTERQTLTELNSAASELDMLGSSYFVQAGLAYIIPHESEEDNEAQTTIVRFSEGLSFEGNFCTHAIVKVGKLAERAESVRSLCFTFDKAILLPYFDKLDEETMLYVPALAVDSGNMKQTA
jgi:hypothetical protein